MAPASSLFTIVCRSERWEGERSQRRTRTGTHQVATTAMLRIRTTIGSSADLTVNTPYTTQFSPVSLQAPALNSDAIMVAHALYHGIRFLVPGQHVRRDARNFGPGDCTTERSQFRTRTTLGACSQPAICAFGDFNVTSHGAIEETS